MLTLHYPWHLSYMPETFSGTSTYHVLHLITSPSISDNFLLNFIICMSAAIIFILWKFFHILYFEMLSFLKNFYVILFANMLISQVKKYADYGNPHTSCQKSYAKLCGNHIQHITAHLDILWYIAKLLQPICCSFKRHVENI